MTALEVALEYCRRGWNPTPVKFRTKVPIGQEWQQRVIVAENAATYFNGSPLNIGIVLGPTSRGLSDADLDCREAIAIAPYILPPTAARFGRASKRESHRLYLTDLAANVEKAAWQYHDPSTGEMLVELRIGGSSGAQTVFPGSMHESGELVTWEEDRAPAAVDGADLQRRVAALAAYSLIARHWPSQGARHDTALALGGFLARTGRTPAVVKTIAEAIARAANDEQWQDRRATAEDSAVNHGKGVKTYGFPQLAKHIGENIARQIGEWLEYKEATTSDEKEEESAKPKAEKQADVLIRLAQDAALFHTGDGRSWADITVGNHRETWPIRSGGFKSWLRHRFWTAKETAPNAEAIETAVAHFEAAARFDGSPKREIYTRIAAYGDKVYLDLVDEGWTVIEVAANGWRVAKDAPVRFRRSPGMAALPVPERGGSLELLRKLANVDRDDFVLLVSWPLAALRGKPPYPILALAGPPGSAKSTLAKVLRDLIDPNELLPGPLPREVRDLAIGASKRFVQAFDNLSGIPIEISDALCRLSTGGGFATRSLYTDDDEVIFTDTRPVLLAGIEDVAGRHDLADRTTGLVLAEIPEGARMLESALLSDFERSRPLILGRLLDIVAHGLRELPNVKLGKLPRMADHALWVAACETAEWPAGTFAKAYASNREALAATSLEADTVATFVVELTKLEGAWSGTAKALLTRINAMADEATKKSKDWPRTPRLLAGRLRRASGTLRVSKIAVTPPAKTDKTRTWTLDTIPDPARESRDSIAQVAQSPENEESANDSNVPGPGYCSGYRAMGDTSIAHPPAPSGYRATAGSPIAQPIARDNPLKSNGLGDVGYLGDVFGPLSGAVCVANGYAISSTPEDRREPEPGQVTVEAWIKVIRPPGLGPPGDDLNDFIVF